MKKLFLILFFLFFFFPKASYAETIRSYDVQITAHKNGFMDIKEDINYDFEGIYRHGIFRYIPTFAKVGDLYRIYKIENVKILRDGNYENFKTIQTDNQIEFKIGNADKTITGAHTYTIFYSVENGIGSNYSDHDEIYWSTTGNGWEVQIEKATAKISTDFGVSPTKVICYQGLYGSKDSSCSIFENTVAASRILNSSEGLTIIAAFPKGTFPPSILSKTPPQTASEAIANLIFSNYYLIFIFLNFVLGGYLIYWYQKHKNKKRFGKPAVNFDIPKDESNKILRPAIAGTIDSAKLERDDITATIFDLAIRKYIKLKEDKTVRSLLPDKKEQIIEKLKEPDSLLESFEKTLMERLFRDGDSVKVSDLRLDFYQTFQDLETEVFQSLIKKGYYTKNPKVQKGMLAMLAIFALFTLNIFLAIVLLFLAKNLNGRTTKGDEIDFKIDGLKLFLKSMDRNYKWQAKNFYTVEQMIPYAICLGYIDQFMEALKILKPDYNPSWYSGGNFYAGYAIFSAASSSNFTTSAPSSSSGMGGGGFSGGGGGGGGGGSW